MVDIRPFKAIRYTQKAGNLRNLITQPYDKIDSQMQQEYYETSPYNYCRLILPKEENRYFIVQQRIQDWLAKNILEKEEKPSIFVCRQEFDLDGESCVRTGMMVALRLYPYEECEVFPHETTYSAPKIDRLNMLRSIKKDLEPLFLIYSDQEKATANLFGEISKEKPIIHVEDAFGVKHTIWRITNPQRISFLQKALEPKTLVITDGHHRYESALAYRDERRKQNEWTSDSPFNFHMSILVPVQDNGLVVLPTHRVLKNCRLSQENWEELKELFEVSTVEATAKGIDDFLKNHQDEHAFCIYDGEKVYGLLIRHQQRVYEFVSSRTSKETKIFDVVILRDVIFKTILKTGELEMDKDIVYVRWTKNALEIVDQSKDSIAFFINPIRAQTVWEIAQQGERLPEKSTDFYPKMASGLMLMDISDDEKL